MAQEEFYCVWNPNGASPTYRHPDKQSAVNEAERLARLNPPCEFFVLKAVSVSKKHDVTTTELSWKPPF